MQVEGRGGVLASSEVKHFAAYTLETNWKHESDGRKGYSANVSAFDWSDSYVVPFAATLGAAGAHSYMCSYNAINGTPSCANAALARLARDHWNMKGFIESDCDAVGELETAYRVADDAAEASAPGQEKRAKFPRSVPARIRRGPNSRANRSAEASIGRQTFAAATRRTTRASRRWPRRSRRAATRRASSSRRASSTLRRRTRP